MTMPGWLSRLIARKSVQHLIRAFLRFAARLGWQFAAAITYFSFLAVVPIIMVGFSAAGFLLLSHHDWLVGLRELIGKQLPPKLAVQVDVALDEAVGSRLPVGIVGLVVALYSGQSWMGNVRSALQAQWRPDFDDDQEIAAEALWRYYLKNLRYLVVLALGVVVSLVLTTVGSAAPHLILSWLGLPEYRILTVAFTAVPIVLAVAADTGLFFGIYWFLSPRKAPVARRYVWRGSFFAAVAFEMLKVLATVFSSVLLVGVTSQIFGSVIGLLLFFYLTATIILFGAAWIGTSGTAPLPSPVPPEATPPPALAVAAPRSRVPTFAAGVLTGFVLRGRRRR